jgi:hypothetical protein
MSFNYNLRASQTASKSQTFMCALFMMMIIVMHKENDEKDDESRIY